MSGHKMYIKVREQHHWVYYCVEVTDQYGKMWGWAFESPSEEFRIYLNAQIIVKDFVEITEEQFKKAFNRMQAKLNSLI